MAYPVLDDGDRQWIESFRAKHDPQAARIGAHFTLVFPVDVEPSQIEPELAAAARSVRPIDFSIHGARVVEDRFGQGHHVFLTANDGAAELSALHDRLYAGSLRAHVRADIPYIPHVTAGVSADPATALELAEELNSASRVVSGMIDRIDIVDVSTPVVRSIDVLPLSAVDDGDANPARLNVLFVCGRNQWRSPTAERLWRKSARFNVRSAGTSASARHVVSSRDLEWADVVLVMESRHRDILRERFEAARTQAKIEVLDIPDSYGFMDEELVRLLRLRVGALLGEHA